MFLLYFNLILITVLYINGVVNPRFTKKPGIIQRLISPLGFYTVFGQILYTITLMSNQNLVSISFKCSSTTIGISILLAYYTLINYDHNLLIYQEQHMAKGINSLNIIGFSPMKITNYKEFVLYLVLHIQHFLLPVLQLYNEITTNVEFVYDPYMLNSLLMLYTLINLYCWYLNNFPVYPIQFKTKNISFYVGCIMYVNVLCLILNSISKT